MKPTPTPERIEQIAKIIDKSAWQAIEDGRDALPHSLWGIRRDGARRTAAEVIAALSVPAAAVVGEQVEWLKARLAWFHLPPGKRDHDTREKWLIQCGMPEANAAPSAPDGWQPEGVLKFGFDRISEEITAGRKQNALTYLSCAFAEFSSRQNELRRLGAQMSNVLYNLAQSADLPTATREAMKELTSQWDAAPGGKP
ncbi:hypothetical protein M2267_003082 [Ensifer sp. KUDG1]|uniref:hypothetical protein n=1 Tax=Ensifer sp. KUDG1 TaxID=3373919 RepID=UPI003D1F2E28